MSVRKIIKKMLSYVPLNLVELTLLAKFERNILSFSQHGEDIVLGDMLRSVKNGFYIDIGAFHPINLSNSYRFYRQGWRGINIDAVPGSMALFRKRRPRDINLEMAVSDSSGTRTLHVFNQPALNTIDPEIAGSTQERFVEKRKVEVPARTLREILNEHKPRDVKKIDFLSLDVEGHELEVLRSNDWEKYSPAIIAVEDWSFDAENPQASDIHSFLRSKKYKIVANVESTSFYRQN